MKVVFSTEQNMLRDSAEKLFRAHPVLDRLNRAHDHGFDEAMWDEMGDLGWFAIGIPEEYGGLGGGGIETGIIMQQIGRSLLVSPFLSSAVMSAQLLVATASEAQKRELLPRLSTGQLRIVVANSENRNWDPLAIETVASRADNGYWLSGCKQHVPFGSSAHMFIVSAITGFVATANAPEISLFIVDANTPGVRVSSARSLDGGIVSDIEFDGVLVTERCLLGSIGKGLYGLSIAQNAGIAAVCAEASGAMQAILEDTITYLKTRKQFGQPLSAFQALQHRLVDMFIRCEFSVSSALLAAVELSSGNRAMASKACSTAKFLISEYAKLNAEDGIQLHGAIGMMEELPVGHYYKRIAMIENMLGSGLQHLEHLTTCSAGV